jgi:hypothetical protein
MMLTRHSRRPPSFWTHAPNSITGALLVDARARRRGELHQLRDNYPAKLIAMYRRIAVLREEQPLRANVTFVNIVEAIIHHENGSGPACNEPH